VEHLRTIHFALVAVCLALIGLVQFERPKDVSTAQSQLHEVWSALDEWDIHFGPTVRGAFRKAGLDKREHLELKIPALGPKTYPITLYPFILEHSEGGQEGRIVGIQEIDDEVLDKPHTLAGFRNAWDLFASRFIVVQPDIQHAGNQIVKVDAKKSVTVLTFERTDRTQPIRYDLSSEIVPTDEETKRILEKALHAPSADWVLRITDDDDTLWLLPIPSPASNTVDIYAALKDSYSNWKPHSFSESFPELTAVTKEMQNESIEQIGARLAEEAAKPKAESFEIFGVKFPVESASRWGIVLVVGIQLYLWIHLFELSPKLEDGDPGWDVAWIGVYRSVPAKAFFLASTALLPLATIVALGNHALRNASRFVWIAYMVTVAVSLLLSILIAKGIPRHDSTSASSASPPPAPALPPTPQTEVSSPPDRSGPPARESSAPSDRSSVNAAR